MQLSGLLEKLKGLFTAAFLISSVTPLLCLILVNAAIVGQFSSAFPHWVQSHLLSDTGPKTLNAAIASVALFVVAYVFSTLNLGLRQILEGERLPEWLRSRLCSLETARLDVLLKQLRICQGDRFAFGQNSPDWKKRLIDARKKGGAKSLCNAPESAYREAFEKLEQTRGEGLSVSVDDLETGVGLLEARLQENSADLENVVSKRLDSDHDRMLELIDYAGERIEADYIRLYNEREFNFSRDTVAPTRMGNIAESVRSYAYSRYRMNLVFFWTRLQKILLEKAEFYKALQDAKTQLDFAVALFWLTSISTVLWIFLLPLVGATWLPLIAVWALGPLLMRTWYLVALQNYRSFADLLRSSLDLFRFDLLKEMKVALPEDADAERVLWDKLNRRIGYAEPTTFISYTHE